MDSLTVRLYNVRFGDGILISVPDEDADGSPRLRHILVDVGNAASKAGGENELFEPVFDDILDVLAGQPLDLYVMSHEHLDHVQGPLWAARNRFHGEQLKDALNIQHVWMPSSSHPDYYDTHADAKTQLTFAARAFADIGRFLGAAPAAPKLATLLRNNNRLLGATPLGAAGSYARTADCVEYIRSLASPERIHYVHRSVGAARDGVAPFDVTGAHPFRRAKLEIWAPEEDCSQYYGHFRPMALGASPGATSSKSGAVVTPPSGVDAGSFYNLKAMREGGLVDNLLAIDKAANNSGIAFCLRWEGWTLLFPGDAEIRSWREMDKEGVLSRIDFLKVGHHGSHNGTPDAKLLRKLFPMPPPRDRMRLAAVSTYHDQYAGVPHQETFDELTKTFACPVWSTLEEADGEPLTIEFDA